MDNGVDELEKSAADKLRSVKIVKELMEKADTIGFGIMITAIGLPVMMKNLREVDPETYYGAKNLLHKLAFSMDEASTHIRKELENL